MIIESRPIEILLVEDSATDVMLAEEALEQGKLRNNLSVVKDGVEAMAFLRNESPYADVPRPDLVLLDLNMPRKDGREVLAEVKADADLRQIPIVVLTTSQAEQDVLKAYGLHTNCYISKPVDFDQFVAVVQAIQQFWFTVVLLPTTNSNQKRDSS
jgi:chemotaxis family two-component system response regulator Rcp1